MKKLTKKQQLILIGAAAILLIGVIALIAVFSGEEKQLPTIGSIVFSSDAAIEIRYDENGNVTDLSAVNGNGVMIAEACGDIKGISCAEAITKLLAIAKEQGYYNDGTRCVILCQTLRSLLPKDENFLENLRSHLQSLLTEQQTAILIPIKNLTPEGYIDLDTAEQLLYLQLGLEETEVVYGDPTIRYECYGFRFTMNGQEIFYNVHALTGSVFIGDIEDFYAGVEETFPNVPDDTHPSIPEEPPIPTEATVA